jgi:small subunit ribosomal protein S11
MDIKNSPKKQKKPTLIYKARFYIKATFNNTLVSVADLNGNVLCWETASSAGFKGARKTTPFAATITITNAARKAKTFGVKEVEIYIKGPGPGREAALRVLKAEGFKINLIADVTPIPHNGCRPKKKRRI